MTDTDTKVCPDCAETVKAAAKVCKHCGKRFEATVYTQPLARADNTEELTTRQIVKTVLAVLAILGTAAAFMIATQRDPNATPREYLALEEKGKEYILRGFVDPSSAQFRNMKTTENCVTGEVNGKNRMGGYVGFSKFYYNELTGVGGIAPEEPTFRTLNQRRAEGRDSVAEMQAINEFASWQNKEGECFLGLQPKG
ncbi:zinc ribbon domain-containing protein [Sphingomonas floccifaciens]|uniref:Zinc ribbon domain-containing protein n=1 Tax=Sphingomonas floccifaciens TaxID=1844115 RepID=A0ABW4N8Q4_9SPHN